MKNKMSHIFFLILFGIIFSACTPNVGSSGLRSRDTSAQNITGANLSEGQGYILADNPIILSGNANLDPNYDLNKLLSPAYITANGYLQTDNAACSGLMPCYKVFSERNSSVLQTSDGKWAYNSTTAEFLEVNTFYHMSKIFSLFFSQLDMFRQGHSSSYDSAIPSVFTYTTDPLIIYANCAVADNASFDPATYTLCFGSLSGTPKMKFAQDSSIIYHEVGHYFQRLQLNFRNAVSSNLSPQPQADLGTVFYNEAGSIGEGLSDYYSYYVNGRTHLGEWAVGRTLNASRPMTESDPLHAPGVSADPSQRLSYPQFLDYDPNFPLTISEDVHSSGMIMSHYLVALTEDLRTTCLMDKTSASALVINLLSETLAELGDFTSKGTNNGSVGKINLNATNARDWFRIANPVNYRSFTQTFAKNLYQNLQRFPACNGSLYDQDKIESLIDDYGLLLFRTYNQHRNFADPTTKPNVAVNPVNRKKSTLISKSLIKLDPTPNASTAFIIDAQSQLVQTIADLEAAGVINSGDLSQTPSTLPYNNGNARVSPGEIFALSPNMYNDSNATMGGVQVLANDWNHVDPATGSPYIFNQWPLSSEGGVAAPTTATENFSPVCLIQSKSADGTSTQWITQNIYRQKVALDKTMCLDSSNTTTSDKDCFIRAVKGVDQAYFSKINSKSTYGQTMTDPQTHEARGLEWSNVILFQVSKHVPPGTVVNCRLRARFTNCEDCYHDTTRENYDYKDLDYNGSTPYKIIQLQFSIID
jgi:hypothetical protein